MVDTIHPVDAVAGSPSYGGRMLRQVNAVAFGGATAARPLGGRSGVRPGTSATTVTATSTTWSCGPLSGVADVETAAEAGLVTFALDAVATGAITAASASFARQDLIYVQIDIPVEDGSATPTATRKYIAGTVASTDPALPVSRAFAIARINVPISGGGSPTVTWLAPYAVAAGGVLPVSGVSQYPAAPRVGEYVDDAALGYALRWNGSAWRPTGPRLLGAASVGQTLAGTAYTDLCTLTTSSRGGQVIVDWDAFAFNGASGADRQVAWRVVCDGAVVGPVSAGTQPVPLAGSPRVFAGYKAWSTPATGSHTWTLQVSASASSSVYVEAAAMTVTEY